MRNYRWAGAALIAIGLFATAVAGQPPRPAPDPIDTAKTQRSIAEQKAEIQAEADKRELKDGEFTTACAQSCASKALVFGDLNDPTSQAAQLSNSNRGTKLLGELGTKPNVTYLERGTWENASHG